MPKYLLRSAPTGEVSVHSDVCGGISLAFNPFIVTIRIILRLVGLEMLSPCLSPPVPRLRATHFTARIPGSL